MSGRVCLDCGEKLRGRSDKNFCSDQCRNNFNNRLNRESNTYVRNIHNLLKKNRKVLQELYESGKTRVHRDALVVSGFSQGFFTHVVEPDSGPVCWYCYEYGFSDLGNDYLMIVMNDRVMEL